MGRLAGIPRAVLSRARQVLKLLESGHLVAGAARPATAPDPQLALFAPATPHPALESLRAIEVDDLTPRQALERLAELVEEARRSV